MSSLSLFFFLRMTRAVPAEETVACCHGINIYGQGNRDENQVNA